MRSRFLAMMLPEETVDRSLAEIQKPEDWVGAWTRSAQRFAAEARREDKAGEWELGAAARRNSAMCYHIAHLITEDDPRTVRMLRGSSVQAFSMAVDRLVTGAIKVGIPWRTKQLPGYLSTLSPETRNAPLIVVLNGATTTKEETFLWSQPFRQAGFAVLNLDWPGTGEATDGQPLTSYCDDLTDGLFEFAIDDPRVNHDSVFLVGVNLGAVVAVRAAAMDRRINAVALVTPPFDPRHWVGSINPDVARQLVSLAGRTHSVPVLLEDFAVSDVLPKLRCPVLLFGGAKDLVIPPDESIKLAGALGDLATLVWYEDGGHGLYDRIDDWTTVAAEWFSAILDAPEIVADNPSTQVEQSETAQTPNPGDDDQIAAVSPLPETEQGSPD